LTEHSHDRPFERLTRCLTDRPLAALLGFSPPPHPPASPSNPSCKMGGVKDIWLAFDSHGQRSKIPLDNCWDPMDGLMKFPVGIKKCHRPKWSLIFRGSLDFCQYQNQKKQLCCFSPDFYIILFFSVLQCFYIFLMT
jgi:hypothetical protein